MCKVRLSFIYILALACVHHVRLKTSPPGTLLQKQKPNYWWSDQEKVTEIYNYH